LFAALAVEIVHRVVWPNCIYNDVYNSTHLNALRQ